MKSPVVTRTKQVIVRMMSRYRMAHLHSVTTVIARTTDGTRGLDVFTNPRDRPGSMTAIEQQDIEIWSPADLLTPPGKFPPVARPTVMHLAFAATHLQDRRL